MTCSVRPPSRSARVSPTQTSGISPGLEHRGRLPRHLLVGFAEEVAPLGVADQHHARRRPPVTIGDRELAGERALRLPVHVLRADADVGARPRTASRPAPSETAGGKNQRRPVGRRRGDREKARHERRAAAAGPWFIFQLAA